MSTITRVSGSSSRIARVASIPSITGIAMSIRMTSGACSRASSIAAVAVLGPPDDGDAAVGGEDRLERLGEETLVVGDHDTNPVRPHRRVPYPRMNTDEAREKIHDLLLTGDNRLKQGVSAEKIRQSYEDALALAREHGLEESVGPLIEIRLADLERLAGGSPPPAPPDA